LGQIDLNIEKSFEDFFRKATKDEKSPSGYDPYPFQKRFAISEELPELIDVPTGMGKTDAVILGWLWKRRFDTREEIRRRTPRRLIYCLPMRVLVEQTQEKAKGWLKNLGMLSVQPGVDEGIAVTVLMGGKDKDKWDLYPDRDAIIIGTQDMLLSRALNRGYGMSRYRWPTHFGLLNNDCLWVLDEIQLMGRALQQRLSLRLFEGN
jgi:CRISPR-associated endonuclease/helicase Cas3